VRAAATGSTPEQRRYGSARKRLPQVGENLAKVGVTQVGEPIDAIPAHDVILAPENPRFEKQGPNYRRQ
jgi:hypothetical protein